MDSQIRVNNIGDSTAKVVKFEQITTIGDNGVYSSDW